MYNPSPENGNIPQMSIYRPSNEARNDDRLETRKHNDLLNSVPDITAIIMEDLFLICGYTTNEDDTSFDHEIVERGQLDKGTWTRLTSEMGHVLILLIKRFNVL